MDYPTLPIGFHWAPPLEGPGIYIYICTESVVPVSIYANSLGMFHISHREPRQLHDAWLQSSQPNGVDSTE